MVEAIEPNMMYVKISRSMSARALPQPSASGGPDWGGGAHDPVLPFKRLTFTG
jgi:hypothetical protein